MKVVFQKFKKEVFIMVTLLTLIAGAELVSSVVNAQTLDTLVNMDIHNFFYKAICLVVIFAFYLLFTYMLIRYQAYFNQKVATWLRDRISHSIEVTSYGRFYEKNSQTYISWFTSDLEQIKGNAINPTFEVIGGIISAVISAVALFMYHWSIVLLAAICIVIMAVLPALFSAELTDKTIKVSEANEKFAKSISDLLSGYDTLFVFRKLAYLRDKIHEKSVEVGDTHRDYSKTMAKVAVSGGIGNVFSQISVFILTGYLAYIGEVSIGSILASMALSSTIFNVLGNISQKIGSIKSTNSLFKKYEQLEPASLVEEAPEVEPRTLIEVKDVSFNYGEKVILNHVSLDFNEGQKYAITGESGTGKSTLLNIIAAKLTEYLGEVKLAGVDVKKQSYNELYRQMVYIAQKPHVFTTTIRENVTLGEAYTDEEVWASLEKVGLASIVRNLPKGLDTVLGDGDSNLSGGQLQRIAFARGLMKQPKVFLLDEVSSNLDEKTTIEVLKPILEDKSVTVLWVTHHLPEALKENIDQTIQMSELNQTA